jgi:hypothetical protein
MSRARRVLSLLLLGALSMMSTVGVGLAAAATVVPACTVITQGDSGKTFLMSMQSCDRSS